jgi:hypothetical protein
MKLLLDLADRCEIRADEWSDAAHGRTDRQSAEDIQTLLNDLAADLRTVAGTSENQQDQKPGLGRVIYAVRTIEAACFLAQRCYDANVTNTILGRANEKLNHVWTTEIKFNLGSNAYFKDAFWNEVLKRLNQEIVYEAVAIHNETVNPPDSGGNNVRLVVKPANTSENYLFNIKPVPWDQP